jgi:hypothetical protein
VNRAAAHILVYGWLTTISCAVLAAPLKADMRAYDLESLGWAAMMSLFGGALRTVFTLATDTAIVNSITKEVCKDAIVAVIAGVIAFIGIEAVRSSGWFPINSELRFAVIVFAGWSRLSFFGWLNRMGTELADSVMAKMRGTIGGATALLDAAASPPPPEDKPKPFQEK